MEIEGLLHVEELTPEGITYKGQPGERVAVAIMCCELIREFIVNQDGIVFVPYAHTCKFGKD